MSKQPSAAQKRQHLDPFSLSFLDIISCGFGAVVVLILIFRFDPFPDDATAPPPQADTAAAYNSCYRQRQYLLVAAGRLHHLETGQNEKSRSAPQPRQTRRI